jgi:choline-glycine betaine transporter
LKSLKNSIIFLETIVSLVIVSIIVSIFFKLNYDNSSNKKFQILNEISNNLKKSNFQNMQTTQTHLTILENQIEKKVLVNKIITQKDNIRLTKYEVAK